MLAIAAPPHAGMRCIFATELAPMNTAGIDSA